MKKYFSLILAVLSALIFTGCDTNNAYIPAGYVGKILTPTGYTKGIIEAGQVDLGECYSGGKCNTLVLLEASSISVKEQYMKKDDVDDRISIGGNATTVDVYVRMKVPSDERTRDAIFAQITPTNTNTERTSMITVENIYNRLAKMDVRSSIRQVLSKYNSVDTVRNNLAKINDELGAASLAMFNRSGVPLDLQNMVISNTQEDPDVVIARNKQLAAQSEIETIEKIGAALRKNPEYLISKKYQTYETIAGKGATMVIVDGQDNGRFTIPLK